MLEDKREDLLDIISELEIESNIFVCYCLEKLVMIFKNILEKPTEEKFRTLKMENNVFYSNIGRFGNGITLLKFLGFVSVRLDNNKLAYQYPGSPENDQLFQIAYDELRMALSKNKAGKFQISH